MSANMATPEFHGPDRVIWQPELRELLGGVSQVTINRQRKDKRLPPPDVAQSRKTVGWRLSTLWAHGVRLL